ncbi:DUF6194 family protein [Microbacterium sp. HD4P20]|uniref:DUF6194 family protein n=1 Tax=Microbacterium sp. HD4P20 TaxID=2864874 RepID=UPI001C641372|nr:DUF6194 family protein [Microbacterium sp. HD4P20]MCP2637852.1 DUF6194 family protein [Microbacterium sp. HD4P20]
MEFQEIVDAVRSLDGALVVLPDESGSYPELAWGDAFFYYAPDGVMPERTQPYGTIITKDYPDDRSSNLDGAPDRFRVNIHVGQERAAELAVKDATPADADAFFRHPLYGTVGWISVVNPGGATGAAVIALLQAAHRNARTRAERRGRRGSAE